MLVDVFGWYKDSSEQNLYFIQKSSFCFSCVSNDAPAKKTPSVGPSDHPGMFWILASSDDKDM